jgi:hypothetical protein
MFITAHQGASPEAWLAGMLKQSAAVKAAIASISRMIVFIGIHRMFSEYLVEGIIGALRQINYSKMMAACCLLLARIRPEQTTAIVAATGTPRGKRWRACCRGSWGLGFALVE